jgi:hypothetical protein
VSRWLPIKIFARSGRIYPRIRPKQNRTMRDDFVDLISSQRLHFAILDQALLRSCFSNALGDLTEGL